MSYSYDEPTREIRDPDDKKVGWAAALFLGCEIPPLTIVYQLYLPFVMRSED